MAENATNAPVASSLVFIHQLSKQPLLSKVRFLGCIVEYDETEGVALIEHKPATIAISSDTKVQLDVRLILEATKPSCLNKGAWVNVIGYVQELPKVARSSRTTSRKITTIEPPRVQAILMWDAGAIRVDKYEQTLIEHLGRATDEEGLAQ